MNIEIKIPSSWHELSDAQAAVIISILTLADGLTQDEAVIISALRISGIRLLMATQEGALLKIPAIYTKDNIGRQRPVITEIPYQRLTGLISAMQWILDMPAIPWRPTRLMNSTPVERHLNDLSFGQWLRVDALFRSYNSSSSPDPEKFRALLKILVPKARRSPARWEHRAVIMWMASVNTYLTARYPDLFRRLSDNTAGTIAPQSLQKQVDAQLRALTKGDPLKEDAVLRLPLHRALTELNAQAAEYDRIRRLSAKNK